MKILYTRVSSIDQNLDRQKTDTNFDLVLEDKCSGAIPFFDRNGGGEILKYINHGVLKELHVWEIDRLGRNLRDILNTIHFFTEKRIPIFFINQGIRTIDADGKENSITKLMISILGTVGEMGRLQSKENQQAGIAIAKLKGKYRGRKLGAKETILDFLSKPQSKQVLDYLKKGYKAKEAAKLAGVHINTVTKVKKLGLNT
ncbi:MAG: recombinase family protein [Algoriphagus sp.]|uniref:recombinase family protein n=1 Tax=Algoriphagus sp. TaxID=1872435 RepID=UPI002615BEC8|nr:recombinase family protein [Algoriphagus sp.]MDG1276322.1 recombinase family protein [Algoriphagus sp.]